MALPAERGLKVALKILDKRFGDENTYMNQSREKLIRGPKIRENDYRALSIMCGQLTSFISFAENLDKLIEIDNQPTIRDIVLRLDDAMKNRWNAYWTGKGGGHTKHIKDVLRFLERETKRVENELVLNETYNSETQRLYTGTQETRREATSTSGMKRDHKYPNKPYSREVSLITQSEPSTRFSGGRGVTDRCRLCGENHMLPLCEVFKLLPVEHRRKIATAMDVTPGGFMKPQGTTGFVEDLKLLDSIEELRSQRARITTCALLDSGSTRSFCSRKVVERLRLREKRQTTIITTLLDKDQQESTCVELMVTSLYGKKTTPLRLTEVIVMDSLPDSLMGTKADPDKTAKWMHLKDLAHIHRQVKYLSVELLIGQDSPQALTPIEVRRGQNGEPFAIRTKLGWSINGPLDMTKGEAVNFGVFVEEVPRNEPQCPLLEKAMKRFWEIDEGEDPDKRGLSVEDEQVITMWKREGNRVGNHHQFPIPFRERDLSMPDNLSMVLRRLGGLKARLMRDKELMRRYVKEMEELVRKGYAEKVLDRGAHHGKMWYLPHHPVFNPNKPEKTRIVFDCAAKFNGVTLNNQIMQGPDMINDLIGILIRFREGRVALSADIEAMFHQVLVDPKDRDVLRFLWWPQGDFARPPIPYRMTRHLFGGVWSPACAAFALLKTLEEGGTRSNNAKRCFYVDDLLLSTDSEDEAKLYIQELQEALKNGGFHLTKWMSNSKRVVTGVPQQERSPGVKNIDLTKDELPMDRALGVLWNLEDDNLKISATPPDKPLTKRGILSTMSSVFDPLGFITPFTVRAKMIFQDKVRRKEGWDKQLSEENVKRWTSWLTELEDIKEFYMNRCLLPLRFGRLINAQLHHFCDASAKAYAVVTYVRLQDDSGLTQCSFVMARSRLAPIKTTSIPRLELCAAVLAAGAEAKIRKEISLEIRNSVFWTDSMIVLQYIRNTSRRFHTFVANRLGIIHRISSPQQWRHVNSEDNPADDASRGLSAQRLLMSGRWKNGPSFLDLPEDSWPPVPCDNDDLGEDPEVKRESTVMMLKGKEPNGFDKLLVWYSSWYALQRAVAYFHHLSTWIMEGRPRLEKSQLKVTELQSARTAIIKYVQRVCFGDDIETLRNGKLTKKSKLYRLEPMLDDHGVIRVGGRRLDEHSECSEKPILLPKNHPVTNLIVQDIHIFVARHSGREHTLANLRRHYWIVAGRPLIDRVLRNCFTCRRVNSKPLTQRQGELPLERISADSPPFTHTGVDCFGPFNLTYMRRTVKRFGCVFTCLSSRAVHLELLHSLDTDEFLNALMRFMARRGTPKKIFSDRGSNFQRANKDIQAKTRSWVKDDKICNALHRRDIEWVFHPPMASHMGGVWERQIRSIRKVLASIIGKDFRLPIDDVSQGEILRRRWIHAQALADRFWKRWRTEYLHSLRMRQRKIEPSRNLCNGDVVLITDPHLPRNRWRLGRVIQVFPGPDGLVRKVRLHTSSGDLIRPIVKLCLLEMDIDSARDLGRSTT
ncbi:uncharacterized protein LOC125046476 [Penaeus chinensis]|uniref:uncharacterized protein LOC125046476 n=1 Tax=Penaeus chinensis TaxID=139456 RepID=UPI001FB6F9BF|nr:uncharacterized protein LOC125046476 [Penaeus chinensis]